MLILKFGIAGTILLAGLLGVLFAAKLEKMKRRETVIRLANTFAGGVFLGAGLLHMFGDAQVKFAQAMPGMEYPVVPLLVGIGFLTILLIDKVLLTVGDEADIPGGGIYPYVLMLALSVHSIITGVALGLESQMVTMLAILIAVLAHKTTAAMALSLSFGRGDVAAPRRRKLTAIFLMTTPLGVALGTTGGHYLTGTDEALAEGLFDALAAGTFIYVAVVDILMEEINSTPVRLPLFVMTTLGFGLMVLLAVWT